MRPGLLKLIDRSIGRMAAAMLPAPSHVQPNRDLLRTVIFIRPGGIGDAVLLVPAIQGLRARFPDISIDILAEKRNAGVFSLCPGIRDIRRYDVPSEFFTTLHTRYDAVIDTEQWHRLSAIVARVIRADIRVGFASNGRRRLFTHSIPYDQDTYESESFLHLLAPPVNAVRERNDSQFLSVTARNLQTADTLLANLGGRPYVVIFPGASILERRWGAERFREVAERLQAMGLPVVIVGGSEDVIAGQEIVSGLSGLNLAGETSLGETAAVIAKSALLVSGDSGILHIGVGLGKPTVSLFGPGIAKKWAPQGENHIVINKNFHCSPCTKFGYTPKCLANTRCMSEISVEEVVAAVVELFRRYGKR